ncbi:MAG: hypothetical protein ACN6OC_13260 [Alcaligenes sp.]
MADLLDVKYDPDAVSIWPRELRRQGAYRRRSAIKGLSFAGDFLYQTGKFFPLIAFLYSHSIYPHTRLGSGMRNPLGKAYYSSSLLSLKMHMGAYGAHALFLTSRTSQRH